VEMAGTVPAKFTQVQEMAGTEPAKFKHVQEYKDRTAIAKG